MSKNTILPEGMFYWVDNDKNIHIESNKDIYKQDEKSLLTNIWIKVKKNTDELKEIVSEKLEKIKKEKTKKKGGLK